MTLQGVLLAGRILLSFVFFTYLTAALGFFLGASITAAHLWLAVLLTMYYVWRCKAAGEQSRKVFLQVAMFVGCCFIISNYVYDISYDGQVYHQEAVRQLAGGWNPLWQYLTAGQSPSAVLLNHYAKGPWLYEAVLYKATGLLQGSKVFNFMLIGASFCFSWAAVCSSGKCSKQQAVVISLLLALNPVSLYQSLSFYIDGQLASLLVCLASLAYMLIRKWECGLLPDCIMGIALTVNIKFTGVVYVCVGLAILAAWIYVRGDKALCRKVMAIFSLSMVLGVVVMGYNPYVTNTVFFGHPFYPLYGAGANTMDIMTDNSPPGFSHMNMFEKTYRAVFSMSSNDMEPPRLKVPFSLEAKELEPFVYGADVRVGGFGPWFSAMLSISFGIWLLMAVYGLQDHKYVLWSMAAVLVSVLVNPEAWWARYVPQFWLVPVVTAAAAVCDNRKPIRILGKGLLVAASVNILLVGLPYALGNYYCTQALNHELQHIANQHSAVRVDFGEFTSNELYFDRWGIPWEKAGADTADISMAYVRYDYLAAAQNKGPLAFIFAKNIH